MKRISPIDKHVGARVRHRRKMLDMSQEKLGDELKLTFQQIQKYENGTNRISASRLYQIGVVLKVPVSFFFEGLAGPSIVEAGASSSVNEFVASREGVAIIKVWPKVTPKVRLAVVATLEASTGG